MLHQLVGLNPTHLSVETTKSPERRVNGVGSVGGCHHHHVRSRNTVIKVVGFNTLKNTSPLFEVVHEGEELRDNPPLHLPVCLLPLGRDGVELVDEDDGGRVLLGLLERFPQVGLGLSGQLGHDFRAVDEEEESTGLVGDGPGHEGFAGVGGSVQEDASVRLHADGFEEGGVAQGKLHHLFDLGELLAAAANIVVADGV